MYIMQNPQGPQGSPSRSSPDSPATEPPVGPPAAATLLVH